MAHQSMCHCCIGLLTCGQCLLGNHLDSLAALTCDNELARSGVEHLNALEVVVNHVVSVGVNCDVLNTYHAVEVERNDNHGIGVRILKNCAVFYCPESPVFERYDAADKTLGTLVCISTRD